MTSRAERVMRVLPLLAIVALGVQLRLTFYQGVIHTDDLVYSQLAWRLSEGVSPFAEPLPPTSATARIGLYGPVALGYWLFGASDVTTLAWPFVCSILGILGAYGIGRLLYNESAGLLAAFFLAVLPTNVAAATALLGDGPIAALSIVTVFLVVLSGRTTGRRSLAALAGGLVCFGIGILNKPLILLLLPLLLLLLIGRRMKWTVRTIGGLLLALAVSAAAYIVYFADTDSIARPGFAPTMARLAETGTDLWQQLVLGQREFSWIAPLWIVAMVALLAWRRREAGIVMLWLGVTFLFGEIGSRTLTVYTPIVWYDAATAARHFLLIAAPAMILVGLYLSDGLTAATARGVVLLASVVTAMCAWLGSRGASAMTWGITGELPADLPFATLSAVATIVVVFGGIASPAILRASSTVVRVGGTGVLVLSIGLASLNHSYRAATEFRNPWVETLPEALRIIESQPERPILVQNNLVGLRLDYLSGYQLGFDSGLRPDIHAPRILQAPQNVADVVNSYVLVDEQNLAISTDAFPVAGPPYLRSPPARWMSLADVGRYRGNHLRIYRVSSGSGDEELAAARAAAATSKTATSLRTLLDAAIVGGEYCEAVQAWFDLRSLSPDSVRTFDAAPILTECYRANPEIAGPSIFLNGDFSQGRLSWSTHEDSDVTVEIEEEPDGPRVWHGNLRRGNWAVLAQDQPLQPNTPYIYEATIRTSVPVVTLYWQSDIGRSFSNSAYSTWTTLQYVFVAPDAPPGSRFAFHPVLMPVAGHAWIKNLRLSELRRPPS